MGWITRYNEVMNLVSAGKISAANKTTLKTSNDLTVRQHRRLNYWNNIQSAPQSIIADYNSVYTAYETAVNAALADMTTEYTIPDVAAFTDLVERMMFSEGYCYFLISKGVLKVTQLRVLSSLSAEGEAGEVAMYAGGIYVYESSTWTRKQVRGYKGSLAACPADESGAFFLPSQDFSHSSGLYINGEQLQINTEPLYIARAVKKGVIHYFDQQWLPEPNDAENYRYVPAVEEYVTVMAGDYPDIIENSVAMAKRSIAQSLAETTANLTAIGTLVSSQQQAVSTLGSTANTTDGHIDTLSDNYDDMKDGLDDILDAITPASSALSTLSGSLSTMSTNVGTLNTGVSTIDTKLKKIIEDYSPVEEETETEQQEEAVEESAEQSEEEESNEQTE